MSNQYNIYNFRAEIQGTGSRSGVTVRLVSLTGNLKKLSCRRSRAMLRVVHSKSFKVIGIYAVV